MSPVLCSCFAVALLIWASAAAATSIPQVDECKDYGVAFDRVFRRPGEAAMLSCALLDPPVFNMSALPYNTTWYHPLAGHKLQDEAGRTIIQGSMLWLLNITAEDEGKFLCVVRTAEGCFKQASVVMLMAWPVRGCVPKERSIQVLTALSNDHLSCPLMSCVAYLDTYSISWYRNCEALRLGEKFLEMEAIGPWMLLVKDVTPDDAANYTCVLSFQLGGVKGQMSETIEMSVHVKVAYQPEILLLDGEINKVPLGSSFHKVCRVSIPGIEVRPYDVLVIWRKAEQYISGNTTHRIHQLPQRFTPAEDGTLVEAELVFSEVTEEDLNVNFTCEVSNDRIVPRASIRLQRDSDLLLPLCLLFGGVAFILIQCVVLYQFFKIEITLMCRDMMPYLYPSTDGDGKLYDAYIVYPRVIGQYDGPVETFAMNTIPNMLEGHYGYRLFIMGRDCRPGEALVDVVSSALSLSRRVLLIYGGQGQSTGGVADWVVCLEQHLALQHSLSEDEKLGVVLIDLGGVSDTALPPAIRLLKDEQGVLQPTRTHTHTCTHTHTHLCCWTGEERGEEEKEESLAFIRPSSRFWRELRYHMPIRGKAKHKHTHTHTQTHTHTLTHTAPV